MADKYFTHIAVKVRTQKQIAILSKILDDASMYGLVGNWADKEWNRAKQAGLVTDAMIHEKSKKNNLKAMAG